MKYCIHCGREAESMDQKFCSGCGQAFPAAPPPPSATGSIPPVRPIPPVPPMSSPLPQTPPPPPPRRRTGLIVALVVAVLVVATAIAAVLFLLPSHKQTLPAPAQSTAQPARSEAAQPTAAPTASPTPAPTETPVPTVRPEDFLQSGYDIFGRFYQSYLAVLRSADASQLMFCSEEVAAQLQERFALNSKSYFEFSEVQIDQTNAEFWRENDELSTIKMSFTAACVTDKYDRSTGSYVEQNIAYWKATMEYAPESDYCFISALERVGAEDFDDRQVYRIKKENLP